MSDGHSRQIGITCGWMMDEAILFSVTIVGFVGCFVDVLLAVVVCNDVLSRPRLVAMRFVLLVCGWTLPRETVFGAAVCVHQQKSHHRHVSPTFRATPGVLAVAFTAGCCLYRDDTSTTSVSLRQIRYEVIITLFFDCCRSYRRRGDIRLRHWSLRFCKQLPSHLTSDSTSERSTQRRLIPYR